jgi:hypothetical protein
LIYLLDLEHTLITSRPDAFLSWPENIGRETYWQKLIEDLKRDREGRVILIAARHKMFAEITVKSIGDKTGWVPPEAYFNSGLPAAVFIQLALTAQVFPKHGEDREKYLALANDKGLRRAYRKMGVKAAKVHC